MEVGGEGQTDEDRKMTGDENIRTVKKPRTCENYLEIK